MSYLAVIMKPLLHLSTLLTIALSVLAYPANVYSQACNVSRLRIRVNNIVRTNAGCQVDATISWIQESNSANKFTNFHIWSAANYTGNLYHYSKPPSITQLANSLGTFVIDNPGSSTPGFNGSYPPAPGVALITSTPSTVVSKTANAPTAGKDSFNVSHVLITLSNTVSCSGHFILKADVWSTQASGDQTVQCFTTNGTFATEDVNVTGQITCPYPRQFQTSISTASASPVSFNYQVYADEAHTGSFAQFDPVIYSGTGTTISGKPYSSGLVNNAYYPLDNLIVVVQVSGHPISTFGLIANTCTISSSETPISFNAKRIKGSGILLTWETAIEQNNKGFEVQRKMEGGDFEAIAFIPSKALNGASNTLLSYEFIDDQVIKGDVEYRLVQTDIDGQRKYGSEVLVKGIETLQGH
jgi:hypothetical protein